MASAPPQPPATAASGWAGLPCDVLWDVFLRIGQREVLLGAGLVCSAWRRLARDEPVLWRRIDLTSPDYDGEDDGALGDDDNDDGDWLLKEGGDDYSVSRLFNEGDVDVSFWCRGYKKIATWKARARAAVDRSAGQCEAFSGRADDEVLRYLGGRAPSLRSLHVSSLNDSVSSTVFCEVIKEFSLLEELELVIKSDTWTSMKVSTRCWAELLQAACEASSHLKCFTVRHAGDSNSNGYYCQTLSLSPQGFTIPTMHGLRYLQLFGDSFTKDVVLSIVDGCPNLQSLDISHIPCLSHEDKIVLKAKCSIIEDRVPWALGISFGYELNDDEDHMDYDDSDDINFYDPYYDGLPNPY